MRETGPGRRPGHRSWDGAGRSLLGSGIGDRDPALIQDMGEVHLGHKRDGSLISLVLLEVRMAGVIQGDQGGQDLTETRNLKTVNQIISS